MPRRKQQTNEREMSALIDLSLVLALKDVARTIGPDGVTTYVSGKDRTPLATFKKDGASEFFVAYTAGEGRLEHLIRSHHYLSLAVHGR